MAHLKKIVLEKEIKPENVNWLIGSFLSKNHPFYTKKIEVGFANRTRVREKEVLHYHKKTMEIYLCLKGKMTLVVEEKKFYLNPQEMLVVKPGLRHKIISLQGKTQYLTIKIPSVQDDKFLDR